MDPSPQHDVTRLLLEWKGGDQAALDALMPLVESELRRLAGGYMRNERPGHTLQPTALVNEAWLRMAQQNQPQYEGRSHFVAIAAQYMRQILVDHARKKNAGRRGAGAHPVDIDDVALFAPERSGDLVALDDGLNELAGFDARQARIVELHFFGGLTYEEIAGFLNIGRSTVIRDLRMAQVWLKNYMAR
ncbi:MAG: sigma-70 family RNA polymerase sigma factor [Acidobacteria bacterium]|nr:sigma-70 family RNA polymerase sigma factor [Acidobacteriota bacterium]